MFQRIKVRILMTGEVKQLLAMSKTGADEDPDLVQLFEGCGNEVEKDSDMLKKLSELHIYCLKNKDSKNGFVKI